MNHSVISTARTASRCRPSLSAKALWGVVLLAASSASAQITFVNRYPDGVSYNRADCDDEAPVEIRWDLDADGTYLWTFVLHERPASQQGQLVCPDVNIEPDTVIVPFAEDGTADQNGQLDFIFNLTPAELMGTGACDDEGKRGNFISCLYVTDLTRDVLFSDNFTVDMDTIVPDRPTLADLSPRANGLDLDVAGLDASLGDIYDLIVQYRRCDGLPTGSVVDGGAPDGGSAEVVDGGTSEVDPDCPTTYGFSQVEIPAGDDPTLTGLFNDVEYQVRVKARDDFDNESPWSATALGTPQAKLGPLSLYNGASNPFSMRGPSCQQSGGAGSWWALLALMGALLFGRRRATAMASRSRRSSAWAPLGGALVLCATLSSTVSAHPGQLTVGLKAGPYVPAIDTETVGGELIYPVYKCFFDDRIMPQAGVDLDVHLFDMFGSLELGLGSSFFQVQGNALPLEAGSASNLANRRCVTPSDESVELTIVMAKPQLTYRLDPLLDYYNFPLVPYVRVGLVAAGYAFTKAGAFDNAGANDGRNPLGLRFGYEAAVGLAFALDMIDLVNFWDLITTHQTKRKWGLDETMSHAYFFVEATTAQIDTFGQPGLILSPDDRLFSTGLPWTFNFGIAMELL